MAIYTKKGDKGQTSLLGGSRVNKSSLRVSCYGTLDEANASLGVAYSLVQHEDLKEKIRMIQKMLFVIGAELASDDKGKETLENSVQYSDVTDLENTVDSIETIVGPLHEFIIPGDTTASAALHQSRSIIRRAERLVNELGQKENVRDELRKYLNRLSDTIFMLARAEANLGSKNKVIQQLNTSKEPLSLTLEIASTLAQEAETYADKIGVQIAFSVVDHDGNLKLFHRMEESPLSSIDISKNKAYTAVALKMPTHEFASVLTSHIEPHGIQENIPLGGGYPVISNNQIIGGIGVSGGTEQQNMVIATQVLSIIQS